jgi:hypothetical protein
MKVKYITKLEANLIVIILWIKDRALPKKGRVSVKKGMAPRHSSLL